MSVMPLVLFFLNNTFLDFFVSENRLYCSTEFPEALYRIKTHYVDVHTTLNKWGESLRAIEPKINGTILSWLYAFDCFIYY